MKKCFEIFMLLAATVFYTACERYEKVAENSPFVVNCFIAEGNTENGSALTVVLAEGAVEGACSLSVSLKEKGSGRAVSCSLSTLDGVAVDDNYVWSFGAGSRAVFKLSGLSVGVYRANITVKRWYHSSSSTVDFEIK